MTDERETHQSADEEVLAFPASFAQQRLWFVDRLEPGTAVYNIPYHHQTRLRGPLDIEALQAAVSQLIDRHETLRTTFATVDGEPVQVISDPGMANGQQQMVVIDLRHLPAAERESEMRRIVEAESRHSFDLTTGPLFYTKLIVLDDHDHVFVQMMSHIVVDGLSVEFVIDELEEFYRAAVAGRAPAIDDLPLQYADFVIWHRQWMESAEPAGQLDYWRDQLAGRLPVMALPTDRPRPAIQRNRGSWEAVDFPPDVIEQLKELSKAEGVSLYMTMLAAFNVLLHRYTGQDDLLVGTPTGSRNQPELERLIAFFVNPVVLRSDLSGTPSFTDLLHEVRATTMGALGNQDVPFERLVEELRPERDLSHNPLFQVSFTLQMAPPLLRLDGTTVEAVEFDNGTSKFDLLAELWEDAGGVKGRFEYDTDLFDRSTVQRMITNYEVLLRSIAANPTSTVRDLDLVADAERAQTATWNDTGTDYDNTATVHGLIEAAAATFGDHVAVIADDRRLTYRQLDTEANRFARYLVDRGVTPRATVGLSVRRSADMMVALLGILKAGAVYLPLDPDYPTERLAFILSDGDAVMLITQDDLVDRFEAYDGPVVSVDGDRSIIDELAGSSPLVPIGADDLAYVIHTSGSTGLPKGVNVRHRNVVNFLTSMADTPGLDSGDVLLAVTTLSFDIAVLELYLPLIRGATVVVAGPEVQTSGEALARTLSSEQVTVMQATPASWKLLLGSGWAGKSDLRVLCGGELLPRDLAEELLPRCSELWNMYGPTETTVWSAARRVTSGDGPVPIGGPIANTQLHVLDANLQPVPIGVAGELCIGGDGVAAGYHDRDELTADRFVSNPLVDRNDDKGNNDTLYRTGDSCRYRLDGTIEFLGRIDLQVKVRGFRIELGEVESVLDRHDGVKEAVVTAQPDPSGDNRLVAYVIPTTDEGPDAATLRHHLASSLPAYMVPTLFVPMSEWPLTNNGKIDRRALPDPDLTELAGRTDRTLPRTDTERGIAEIWSQLLGISEIGVEDNFFELGGHSLLAAQIMTKVNDVFGVAVPLPELFADPTVAHLADRVGTAGLLVDLDIGGEDDREEFVL